MLEINLLPASRQAQLLREVVAGAVTVFLYSVIVGLVVITLTGLLIVAGFKAASYKLSDTDTTALDMAVKQYQELRQTLATKNTLLHEVAGVGNSAAQWSPYVDSIFTVVPPDATISGINAALFLAEGKVVSRSISLSGQAATRNTLILYEDRLRALPLVSSLDAPSSNLVKRDQPFYQFTIAINEAVQP